MTRILEKIRKEINPKIQAEYKLANVNAVPKIEKIVINVGIRSESQDGKIIENIEQDLRAIAGQSPVKTLAKKAISSFKIRQGQVVGMMVTLRGARMYEFLDKLFNVTLARVRDFRGLSEKGFDSQGNFSIGFRDQLAFPEISAEHVKQLFGLQVTISTNAKSLEQAKTFLKLLGLPIKPEDN